MPQPFFIAGSGRSGSTLLYRMLSQHPRIALTNEGHVADFLAMMLHFASVPQKVEADFVIHQPVKLRGIVREDCVEAFGRVLHRHVKQLLEEFYEEQFRDRDYTYWGDKLPRPDVCLELKHLYPEAKWITLVRDPRAICSSLLAMAEKDLPAAEIIQSVDLETIAHSIENAYAGLDTWLGEQCVVHYESLVRDRKGQLARVLDHLGLDGVEATYESYYQLDPLLTHTTTASVEESLVAWKDRLTREQRELIESECAGMIERYGYR